MHIPILHQDDDIIVVNKPAGIPTHATDPADPYLGDALRIVKAQTGLPYLGMHQRLDAETSGVLLFAARREANAALARAFEGREVRKVYLALVHGTPKRAEGVIDAPIVRERGERYRVTGAGDPRGLAARTRYGVVATTDDRRRTTRRIDVTLTFTSLSSRFTLLELIPETGRPHQIRVHLAHIGCPVVGDALYDPQARPAPRLCLHAYQLTLPHPTTGQPVTFTAPAPALFERPSAGLPELEVAASARPVREIAAKTPDALRALLRLAVERRAPLAADHETTIYRLVNGAADGLPGMTADRYGDALILSLYDDTGHLPPPPSPESLVTGLAEIAGGRSVYVKYRPPSASRLSDGDMAALAPHRPILGPDMSEFLAQEEGLNYLIRPGEGFSVGLFPDMRETCARVRAWAAGKRVLNCFAYTCGFGVAATAGGATRVLNLDLSKSALEWGKANYRANRFVPDDHDFVYGDVFDWLARLAKRDERFDLVILDPPGFSRTKSRSFSAARDYGDLAGLAARVIAADGLLLACCNVAELPWRAFRERVLAGVASSNRAAEVVGVYHEPALDFPAPMRGEPYLKILAARLGAL